MWNVGLHGATSGQEMEMIKAVMILERIEILAVVETLRGRDNWLRNRGGAEEGQGQGGAEENEDTSEDFGEDCIWVEWNRKAFNVRGKKGDGGLGLIVNKRCVGSDGEVKIQRGDSVEV
jgi:hypothetical protein